MASVLSAMWSSHSVPVSGRSVALSYGGNACVLALDPTASGAVTAQGSTTVALDGCSVFSDSNSGSSVSVGGSATVSAVSGGAGGPGSGAGHISTTPSVTSGDSGNADPHARSSYPSFSRCAPQNLTRQTTI